MRAATRDIRRIERGPGGTASMKSSKTGKSARMGRSVSQSSVAGAHVFPLEVGQMPGWLLTGWVPQRIFCA